MTFVLDASATASWAFEDEDDPVANAALGRLLAGEKAWVPVLWWFEVRNLLIVNERRGRITAEDTGRFLRDMLDLPIVADDAPSEGVVLALARTYRLTIYDASYLELALRKSSPLVTLDRRLLVAAAAEGVGVLQP